MTHIITVWNCQIMVKNTRVDSGLLVANVMWSEFFQGEKTHHNKYGLKVWHTMCGDWKQPVLEGRKPHCAVIHNFVTDGI